MTGSVSEWYRKYNPEKLDDFVLSGIHKQRIRKYIKQKNMSSLIFYGTCGTGKTSLAEFLANKISNEVKKIPVPSNKGIKMVRDEVERFFSFAPMGAGFDGFDENKASFKVIILDEMDSLKIDAKRAIRSILDKFGEKNKIIFTFNETKKIDDAIKSRCDTFEFGKLPTDECVNRLEFILSQENVKFDRQKLVNIVEKHNPDIRRMIGTAQSYSLPDVNGELVLNDVE